MLQYGNKPDDKPGYPTLPLNISMNEQLMETLFKLSMKYLITEKQLKSEHMLEMNKEMRKIVIRGLERIDFEDSKNKRSLNKLLDELWSRFIPILRIKLRAYNREFVKKPADKV